MIAPQRLRVRRHGRGNLAVDGVRQQRIRRHIEWIIHHARTTVSSKVTSSVNTGVVARLSPSRNPAAWRQKDRVTLPPPTGPQQHPAFLPAISPAPRRERGQKRCRETGDINRVWEMPPSYPHSRGARHKRLREATYHTPIAHLMGDPETVRLVDSVLGLDSDRHDGRRPRKAPVSGRTICNLIMPREHVFGKEPNPQQPMARREKMGRKARSPQISQKIGDGGASTHFRHVNVGGLTRFTLTVFVFCLSVLGCVTLLWDPPHSQEVKFRHMAHI